MRGPIFERKSDNRTEPGQPAPLSLPLVAVTVVFFVAGVVVGLVVADPNSQVPENDPPLNAWPMHIVVTVIVAVVVAAWVWRALRRTGRGPDLLAPWRARAAHRLAATAASVTRGGVATRGGALVRAIVVLLGTLLLIYLVFRLGFQFGLIGDESQVVNAWGGPTYIGAFYAHLIDSVALALVALTVVDLLADRPRQVG